MEDIIATLRESGCIKKRPPTERAQFFLDRNNGNVNEAFNEARFENDTTLRSIYAQGVDINFDVDKPNKLNMFHSCITAYGACNPYFLELMFKFGRKDIKTDGQYVFEMACSYGDVRHVEVFMSHYDEYKWDVFTGMKKAVAQDNRSNLHHLFMYHSPLSKEELATLWDEAIGSWGDGTKSLAYLAFFYSHKVTKEALISVIENQFSGKLIVIISLYLKEGGEHFPIDGDLLKKVLVSTEDRIYKLKLLNEAGFIVEGLDEIKEEELPMASTRRYITFGY